MTYVIYEIHVTPFLNKVCMNMFTAVVVCNLDGLYKKLETLLRLFSRKLFVITYMVTRLKQINFAIINQGHYGSKTS